MDTIRRISQLLMTTACFLMLAACAQGAVPDARTTAAAQEDITQVQNAYLKAFNSKDAVGFAATFSQDAMLMPPNQPAVKTQLAVQDDARQMLVPPISGLLLNATETIITNGYAFSSGYYTLLGDKGATLDRGKFLEVFKQTDQGWKIYRDIYNSDMPAAGTTPAPAATTAPAAATH